MTPDAKKAQERSKALHKEVLGKKINEDDFFDLLSRTQSKRMDDQRCSLKVMTGGAGGSSVSVAGGMSGVERKPLQQQPVVDNQRNILPKEMIAALQSERMDGHRAVPKGEGSGEGAAGGGGVAKRGTGKSEPDDAFLDMLMRCQGSRLEEQRTELPKRNALLDAEAAVPAGQQQLRKGSVIGATVPDEDFFSLISRVQGGRMEDQRAAIPLRRYQNGAAAAAAEVARPANGRNAGEDSTTKNGAGK